MKKSINISRKIGKFISNNKVEFGAFICVVLFLFVVLTVFMFTSTFSRISERPTGPSTSRVEGTTLYVDDLVADYDYLQGLNYTEIRSTSIPSGNSTGYFDNENLVKVQIIYDGADINNSSLVGAISPINNENINKLVYYKFYALERNSNGSLATDSNGNNYIRVELIDNPFSKRPYVNSIEYGFNGWVCNQSVDTTANLCENATIGFRKADYTRYMDIPVNNESEFIIHLNVSWYEADVVTSYGNISNFSTMQMQPIYYTQNETIRHTGNLYWKQNYTQMVYIQSYNYNAGYLPVGVWYRANRNSGTYSYVSRANSVRADRWYGNTTLYTFSANTTAIQGGSQYTGGSVTFVPNFNATGSNTEVTINSYDDDYMDFVETPGGTYSYNETVTHYLTYLSDGDNAGGFYFKVNNPTSAMINTGEYYDVNGVKCSSASSCTTAYKLIQYNDGVNNSNGHSISIIETVGNDDIDAQNYYYLVTRDMNIFRYTSNTRLNVSNIQVNRPFTVTGTTVNGTSTSGVLSLNGGAFTASNDIVIENIKIYGPNSTGTRNIAAGNDSKTSNVIYANSHNLKIGRNVTSSRGNDYLVAESILSGTNRALSGTFKVIVESGKYYAYHSGTMDGSSNYTFNQTVILGNDYDRVVTANNSKLKFLIGLDGYTGGSYTAGSSSLFASYTVFRSGLFGYNDDGTPNNDTTAGMYIGGYNGLIVNSLTGVKIEGGNISYATGGYGYNGSETTNATYIGMSGGTIRQIYGGAGYSTTKGNRIINVTGGTVSYSILGGSDSFSSNSTTDGVVNGSTLIYVGGTAHVGGGTGTVQGVEAGSVFGAGGGNSNSTQKGTVRNSHVIINGGTIDGSVYGGGNYGSTGTQSNSASSTIIDVYDGTIGNVYGASKSAGFSKSNYASSSIIDINVSGGTIGNVYGGSDESGTVYGSVDIDITGGSITSNVYGGGRGSSTVVSNNVDVTIGTSSGGNKPTIGGSVYGGSALGTVNGSSGCNSVSSYNTHVVVNSGVNANVFGGGQGDNSNSTPYVCGNVTVDVNGGTNTNVYGGNDLKGTPNGRVTVNVNGGTTTNAYAGGNQTSVVEPYINITGGTVTSAFGGGNNAGVTTSHVTVSGGTATNVFGGSNSSGVVTTSNVIINSGTVTNAFGGNNVGGTTGTTNVTVNGGNVTSVYGGGEQTSVTTRTNVIMNSSATNVFGGSDSAGTVAESHVTVNSGATITSVYGGNNLGGSTTTSNVLISGGTVTSTYGGGLQATTGVSNVTVNTGTSTNVFGGGKQAGVTTTHVAINGGNVTSVYGGSDTTGDVTTTNVNINSGAHPTNVFGGNNLGGTTTTSHVNINSGSTATYVYGGNNLGGTTSTSNVTVAGGTVTSTYGGGLQATTGVSNVIVNTGTSTNVFGGGKQAGVTTTHVDINGGNVTNVYGGSDTTGNVTTTNVNINTGGNVSSVYGGNNLGGTTATSNVNIKGGTVAETYGGGLQATTGVSNVNLIYGTSTNIYGGGKQAGVTTTNVNLGSGTATNVFGGSNMSGNITTSNIQNIDVSSYQGAGNTISVTSVYGGNNLGGSTTTANIDLTKGTYGSIYGGGERATTGTSSVDLSGVTVNTVIYGGGDQAAVTGNTRVDISNSSSITGNVYGGGNEGAVGGNTTVSVTSSSVTGSVYGGGNAALVTGNTTVSAVGATITGNVFGGGNNGAVGGNATTTIKNTSVTASVFAGGNGATATVVGDNKINVEGTSTIGQHVFGGGNAAKTGCDADVKDANDNVIFACSNPNSSTSIVNIAGATIGGNVYGGANTSVVYGETFVNVGINTIDSSENLTVGDIDITGTVFGGGEANASGSEDYDFNFISVTQGININIDASSHSVFDIDGSIFGSGNASSSGGYSYIYIKNYGTFANPKKNVSIQRTDIVTLDNCAIVLEGAQDRTNKYKTELFTFSRIGHLKLKNNTSIFLERGANLLEEFSSLVDVNNQEVLAQVQINDNTHVVTKNVDNRVYMYEGRNLNISDDESLGTYSDVNGMSFFGMFKYDRNGNVTTGLYSNTYDYDDSASGSDLFYFSLGSYVVGKHKNPHDIYVDGFYSNYANEDGNAIVVDYIEPTPSDATYYRWVIGESVEVLEVNVVASKYSTLGTDELQLMDYYHPNTEVHVLGVSFADVESDVNLKPSDQIPRYSTIPADANTNFALAMKTGNTGWITRGGTEFTTTSSDIIGNTYYKAENSNAIPSFVFYLYHSKNISQTRSLGTVTISLMIVTPTSDLSNTIKRVNVEVNMNTAFYEGDFYEGAMMPGAQYEMFANSAVNITNKSTFSTYFSLYSVSSTSIYRTGYKRFLISSYAFPENTKITMIDFASSQHPEYYYFIIDSVTYANSVLALQNDGEVSYRFSDFIRMGSSSSGNTYDDAVANVNYYDSTLGKAEEEFIFIVDFKDTSISGDVLNKTLLMELRDSNNSPVIPVLDVAQQRMFYNLYDNKDAILSSTASLSNDTLYIGQSVDLSVITSFAQQTLGNITIIDTNYYEQRLGIKLSLLNENDEVVNGASLLGVAFIYDGVSYYPRQDGTVRFNIAESVANVSSRIKIDARTSNLVTGDYTLVIETFGSSDGIYYGTGSTNRIELDLAVVNEVFGLDATLANEDVIIDKETGLTQDGDNHLTFQLQYASTLRNPSIRVSLYRRTYTAVYDYTYTLVDFMDYFDNEFSATSESKVYLAVSSPSARFRLVLNAKDNLMTGTYQVRFNLYDNNSYVGHINKYIIIE